jgi:hypothetical protein
MSDFQKISGKITSVSSLADKNGKDYWKIGVTVEGKQYPVNGTTWDNPTEYKANQVIELTMSEKIGTAINPKTNKPYTNRTFLLPNHVCKDGTLLSSKQIPSFRPPEQKQNTVDFGKYLLRLDELELRVSELERKATPKQMAQNTGLVEPDEDMPQAPTDDEIPF